MIEKFTGKKTQTQKIMRKGSKISCYSYLMEALSPSVSLQPGP